MCLSVGTSPLCDRCLRRTRPTRVKVGAVVKLQHCVTQSTSCSSLLSGHSLSVTLVWSEGGYMQRHAAPYLRRSHLSQGIRVWVTHIKRMPMLVFWVVMPCGLVDTNVSEEHTAFIFSPEDGGIYLQVTWHYNPEDQHGHLHRFQ
jgi:hypothetical protein